MCKITGCDNIPLILSDLCWDHLPDREAYVKILIDSINNGQDLTGANLQKVVLSRAYLKKAVLTKANLAQADFSETHLFDSNLEGADLIGASFVNCELTNCSLKNSDLTKASLSGSRLWNANLTDANLSECNMGNTDLWNAGLFNVKLWRTVLDGAKSLHKRSFSGRAAISCHSIKARLGCLLSRWVDNPRINEIGTISAEESYRNLKNYFVSMGMYNDASWASFKEKTMERLILKKRWDLNYLPSLLMNILCGYGEKPYRIVTSAMSTILLFAVFYFSLNAVQNSSNPAYLLRWVDYLYYSTVTFTTVGYGDFVPRSGGLFKLLAASEAFLGTFLTGLFIFTLARKYSAR